MFIVTGNMKCHIDDKA